MKWVGQHIVDLIAHFKSDVYLDDLNTTTETNVLVVDSAGLVSKSTSVAGDLTAIGAGIGISGSDLSGPIPTLNLALTELEPITPEDGLSLVVLTGAEDHNLVTLANLATLYAGAGLTATNSVIAVDASQTGITRVGTLASLEVVAAADLAGAAMTLYNQDIDQIALDINALNTTANILDINASALTNADAINIDCTSLTTGSALVLDVNDSLTTSAAKNLVNIDYDKSGNTASGQTSQTKGLQIDMTDGATSNVGTINMTGTDIQISSADADGTVNQTGISVGCTGGDAATTYGYKSHVTDGGTDFYARSSADAADYFSMATTTNGATTLTTVDGGAAAADLTFTVDGKITMTPADITGTVFHLDANAAVGNIVDIDAGKLDLNASTFIDLTAGGAVQMLTSSVYITDDDPIFYVTSKVNSAAGGNIIFNKQKISGGAIQAGQDNDDLGTINWKGYNDGTPALKTYATMLSEIADATTGQEAGRITLNVAEYDGTLTTGLKLDGDTNADGEIDVTIAAGAGSTTTIAGDLDVTGSITGGYSQHYRFMGFNNNNTATNVYEYSEWMTDTKAPLEHTKNHNATITTAIDVSDVFFAGGQVIPKAGTVKSVVGWAHTNGTGAEHKIALVRLRPIEDNNSDIAPVLLQETTWDSLGNDKLKLLDGAVVTGGDEVLAAGDILMTMIKDDTGSRQVYFNITVEVEF